VGAVLVLSGMVIGMTMNAGMSIWLAIPLALAVSLLVGAINGVLIAYVGVPPFVVTLGILSIARSVAMVLSNNRMVYQFGPDQPALLALGGGFVELEHGEERVVEALFIRSLLFLVVWWRRGRGSRASSRRGIMSGVPQCPSRGFPSYRRRSV
jgi:ribose transport system permease protein